MKQETKNWKKIDRALKIKMGELLKSMDKMKSTLVIMLPPAVSSASVETVSTVFSASRIYSIYSGFKNLALMKIPVPK